MLEIPQTASKNEVITCQRMVEPCGTKFLALFPVKILIVGNHIRSFLGQPHQKQDIYITSQSHPQTPSDFLKIHEDSKVWLSPTCRLWRNHETPILKGRGKRR